MREKQSTVKNAVTPEPDVVTQRQLCHREQEVEAKVRILNLQVRNMLKCFGAMIFKQWVKNFIFLKHYN